MKKLLILLCILSYNLDGIAQKTINNPDHISSNINGSVTKVELADTETIIHFHIKSAIGSWIAIPRETYIEDSSGKGEKLYIVKTEGISLTGKNYFEDFDEIRYKLYFPPLPKGTGKINYGESNKNGNWFIYKLDITKDGIQFLNTTNSGGLNNWNVVIGYPTKEAADASRKNTLVFSKSLGYNTGDLYKNIAGESVLPKDLPEDFFGSWYDKYGTLILITTPDYIVSDYRVQYYQDIKKASDTKFFIKSANRGFEILSLDKEIMTIRTDRLSTLKRKPNGNQVPKFLKGDWLHWLNKKEIKVTDDYFYNNDHGDLGVYEVNYRIDQVVESESGNVIWFVLYNEGDYFLYSAKKTDDDYVLQPRGYANAKYKKVKD